METEITSRDETPSALRISASAVAVLEAVRRAGAIARSVLPQRTLLSQQSVHRITEELIERRILQVAPPLITGRGKPSPQLALHPDGAYGLGLTVDSDQVSLSVTNLVGDALHHETLVAPSNDPKAVLAEAQVRAAEVIKQLDLPPGRVAGLGVSIQGFRSGGKAIFATPVPLAAWTGKDLDYFFEGKFDFPVYVENNANLGAIAELWVGAGRHYNNFAYLSLNHGFGGGLVLNGEPYLGAHLNAGENSAIYNDEESQRRPAMSSLLSMMCEEGHSVSSVSELKKAYDPSLPAVARWITFVTPALNQYVRALNGILDPAAIVFGGEAPRDLRQRLIEVTDNEWTDRLGRSVPGPDLLVSSIDGNPSRLGAALLPIRAKFF